MGTVGQRMRLRLFLEGVEVPVIAAQIQAAPNSPAACTLQVPPLPEGTRFPPRVLVHLFFLDFYETQSPLLKKGGEGVTVMGGKQDPTMHELAQQRAADLNNDLDSNPTTMVLANDAIESDNRNDRYKLLFGGEIVGFQWTKSQNQRSLVFQCVDWSNYWDYAQQWVNNNIFGPGIKAMFSGSSTNMVTDLLDDTSSVIIRMLKSKSLNYPALGGLLGGIVHVLEAIGGSYTTDKKVGGQNVFFTLAELRLHILQMITAYDKDETANKLLDAAGWNNMFGRILGGLGEQTSIRQAINALMPVIFHETYPIPTPMYVPGTDGTVSGYKRTSIINNPATFFIGGNAKALVDVLAQCITDLNLLETTPPDVVRTALQTRLKAALKLMKQTSSKIPTEVKATKAYYTSASSSINRALTLIKSKSFTTGKTQKSIADLLNSAGAQLDKAANYEYNSTPKKKAIPARLNQQIFRPDIWFSSPPRCNVLFPENYHTMNYSRSFLQEPTRLLLKTNDAFFGEDELFDKFFFAPKAVTLKAEANQLKGMLTNDVLDHELYSGILPVFEKMSEMNIFAIRSGTINGTVPKEGLAQRSCNFLYFKYRFASRQMSISAKFNPYLVPGFPGLIIDKYVDADVLENYSRLLAATGRPTREMNKLLGTNFLANFTEVSHSVDQSNGGSSVNCSYSRQPEEKVEFLGATEAEGAVDMKKKTGKNATIVSYVASVNAPRVGSLGPKFGEITAVLDISQAARGSILPLYRCSRDSKGKPSVPVEVGATKPASDFGDEVVEFAGSPDLLVTFKAFQVTETKPQYKRGSMILTAEDLIHPGWYSDLWRPQNIGAVYENFFKIGSINDPSQIGYGGGSAGVQDQESQITSADEANTDMAADERGRQKRVFTLLKDSSLEDAVAYLVTTYSYIKQSGLDVDEFIRAYTWRPIATMIDMFGTSDLDMKVEQDGTIRAVSGIEGFHSRAFGPYNNLFGLVAPDIQNVLGIKRGTTVAQKADKRKDKQDAVKDYVAALSFARAILG